MKVLLISPLTVQKKAPEPVWVPLGLPFIAALLERQGHTVSIFDRFAVQSLAGPSKDRVNAAMLDHIKNFKPDLIGFNTVSPLIYDTVECAALVRKYFQGPVIAGGHHTTAMPELTLKKIPGIDAVVSGEGELAALKLAAGEEPSSIPGLWWRDGGRIMHSSAPAQLGNLDDLPFPNLDLLDMKFYTRPGTIAIRGHYLSTVTMLTSRGCNRRCEFCAESMTFGKGVRFHSPGYVIEWVKKMIKDYSPEGIYFCDNNFLINRGRTVEICERLIKEGLNKQVQWSAQVRADNIDEEILSLLKRAGCVKVEVGVESSLQAQLDAVDKKTTVQANERAVRLCRKHGVKIHAYMITGFEGEKVADLEENLRWLKRVKPDTFSWSNLSIHPGTVLYEKKGNCFFENNEWNRENITDYYARSLSDIPPAERTGWITSKYNPYLKLRNRLNIIKVNPPRKLFSLAARRAAGILKPAD